MKTLGRIGLTIALLAVLGSTAQAVPLTVGGGWQEFWWGGDGDAWNDEGAFTFLSDSWTNLRVTDMGDNVDRFEVYDGGILLGTTSAPTGDLVNESFSFDKTYGDSSWSSGLFLLAPGSHSITLFTFVNPYETGRGGLRVDLVPVPGAILLGTLGVGLVGWIRRRGSL